MISFNDKETNFDVNTEKFFNSINSIKALAIIPTLIYHVYTPYIFYLSIWLDIFIFLSGFILTFALERANNKNHSWKAWYKRRLIRIFPALILTTLFIIIYRFIIFKKVEYSINSILIHMSGLQSIPGNPDMFIINANHWYMTLMLSCYILFPILYISIKKNIKITVILGILLYIPFILLSDSFYRILEEIIQICFQKDIILQNIQDFFPRYFVFFFGMLLGSWIAKDDGKNLSILQSKKCGIISLVILIILFIIYSFILTNVMISIYGYDFSYFDIFSINIVQVALTLIIILDNLIFPLMAISFIIFFIFLFSSKPEMNKIFNFIGKETYEIFLVHTITILQITFILFNLFSFLDKKIIWLTAIIVILLISIFLAYPIYYIGIWIKSEKKTHKLVIYISISLIIYAILAYIILIFNPFVLNDVFSIVLFCLIITILVFSTYINTLFKKRNKVNIN